MLRRERRAVAVLSSDARTDARREAAFLREQDASLDPLRDAAVAVVGYGNLGRSMALNLRDSGLDVRVGNVDDDFRRVAVGDGFERRAIEDAVADADLVYVLLPDEVMPEVFPAAIAPRLSPGSAVCFASGYALANGLVEPPAEVDVLLLAPRMVGEEVRRAYLDAMGFLSYVSVERDATGTAEARLLALALASGSLRRGALRLSARQEAALDLFVEQTVGAYLGVTFQIAFQVATEAGLPPEAVVAELYMSGEMERAIATMREIGFFESVRWHGRAAAFGGFTGTLGVDREAIERHFRSVLAEIESGGFARRLQEEAEGGYPTCALIDDLIASANPISRAEGRLRAALE